MPGKTTVRCLTEANHWKRNLPLLAAIASATGLLFFQTLAAHATIGWSGDVSPTNPSPPSWIATTIGYVGQRSVGTITVNGGSTLLSSNCELGSYPGSTGTVTITGNGSKWNNGLFVAGNFGSGTLTIESRGQVDSIYGGILGSYPDSNGIATVTGTGSALTSGSDFYVGLSGYGRLTVQSGGLVNSTNSFIGTYVGSSGLATVTGIGSTWNNSGGLYVASEGSASLNVTAGGQVTNTYEAVLGYDSGSTGLATVTGGGSKWTNQAELYIGNYGSGTLTVTNGGAVTAGTLYASLGSLSGNGIITVTKGAVLDAELVFDRTHGLQQTLAFGSGGTLSLNFGATGALGAGYKGGGTLRIADNIAVASSSVYLGYHSGSSGTATVTGVGSKLVSNQYQ